MSHPEEQRARDIGGVHLEAEAAGGGMVNQAGHNLYLTIRDTRGVRRIARASADTGNECPYPGLAAFSYAQAEYFCGRDRLTADMVRQLNDCLGESTPLMVVAPSGAGKSSLLMAGLLPAIEQGRLTAPGSQHWPRIVFTPTVHPMRKAASCIAALGGIFGDIADPPALSADPGQVTEALQRGLRANAMERNTAARAVIVVDQFEELFTLCADEEERQAFIGWLWHLAQAQAPEGPLALVVCGLRADFYAECANYPHLLQALQTNQLLVGPMSADELREAILYPAEAVGLDIEPGLIEVLLRDLGTISEDGGRSDGLTAVYDAGRLPLLGYALQATWQQRHNNMLTVDGYGITGGIQHAVATAAERVFSRLDASGQCDAHSLFLRLVKIGENGDDSRRPVGRDDLLRDSQHPESTRAVLDAYTSSRLLTQTRDAVEVTHEALIRAWPRLRQWIDQDRAGNLIRQDLEDAAREWDHDRGDISALYRGSRLDTARAWASDHEQDISRIVRDFLVGSRRIQRRSVMLRRSAVAVLAVLTLIASIAFGVAFWQRSTAFQERDQAIYNQTVAEAVELSTVEPSVAAQLNLTAYHMRQDQAVRSRLLSTENALLSTTFRVSITPIRSLAFSPKGRVLATGGSDGAVRLWEATNPVRPVAIAKAQVSGVDEIYALAFSPDGKILATGDKDGTIRLWNTANPAHPVYLGQEQTSSIFALDFSPAGNVLASGSYDGVIRLWNVTNPAAPRLVGKTDSNADDPSDAIYTIDFSPKSRVLASGRENGSIQMWDVANLAHPTVLSQLQPDGSSTVRSVAFSADGRTVVRGGDDGYIQLWNVTNPARPTELNEVQVGNSSSVGAVGFSPDGGILATGSADGTVALWNVTNPAYPMLISQPQAGNAGTVYSVAFSPDGHDLATAGADGIIQQWQLPLTIMVSGGGAVSSSLFSPDHKILATGSENGAIQLWNVSNPTHPIRLSRPVSANNNPVDALAFSLNGRILVSIDDIGDLMAWNVTNPAHPALWILQNLGEAPFSSTGNENPQGSVAFSPDGQFLATGSENGTIQFWEVTRSNLTATGTAQSATAGTFESVAFSPISRILAGASDNGTIQLWSYANPAHPVMLRQLQAANGSSVRSLAFSPDGHILVTGSQNGTINLWKLTRRAQLAGHSQVRASGGMRVYPVIFSHNGRILATGSGDGSIQLWDIANPANPTAVGQPISASSNGIASMAFSSDGRTLASGDSNGIIWLWDLNVSYAIVRICATTKGDLTAGQWREYIPQLPYDPPCGH